MSFFSEEKGSELKDLFFESAGELLQVLNEDGMRLEQHPFDAEIVRSVRRSVHTLKGDSAACGYTELSSLAHELEDVLAPELAKKEKKQIAEAVLASVDVFQSMLTAYRASQPPPSGESIRAMIRKLIAGSNKIEKASIPQKPTRSAPRFQWTEYGRLAIADAASRGLKVVQVSMSLDPHCEVRAAALQMVKNALQDLGNLLTISPDDSAAQKNLDVIEAALASSFDEDYIAGKCRIPGVISDVFVERYHSAITPASLSVSANGRISDAALNDSDILDILPEVKSEPAAEVTAAQIEDQFANNKRAFGAETTLRVDAEKVDAVLNLVGELIIGKSMLTQTISEFDKRFAKDPLRAKFADALSYQARVLNDLQKSVMKVRMVPVEQLFRRFPRVVRDVSKALSKEVNLVIKGQNTDLDKSILDVLAEPMAHLVRNAIGHGIESPIDRMAAGKATQGTLKLNAYHQGNHIVIEVSDDGAGIDVKKVTAQAIARGLISKEDAANLTEGEALNLIFHPGLSTAAQVTEVSGRGIGMDVVKTVLESLKGAVSIKSKSGEGTIFYLRVPLTLAIIKALLFRAGEKLYAVPLASVTEITRAAETEIHQVDHHEVLRLREQVLTLVRVNKLSPAKSGRSKKIFVIVIAIGDRKFGLIVDKLVGEEELVIKALDDQLVATDLVSGASILGDGTVVLILNVNAVVSRLARPQAVPGAKGAIA